MKATKKFTSGFFSVLLLGLSLVLLQGCLFDDDDKDHDHGNSVKSGDTVNGMHDMFTAVITFDNAPVIGTDNEIMVTVSDADANAVSADGVTASTWMPTHGHGSSPDPMVHDMGMGMYHVMKINITMDGDWEIHVHITRGNITERFHIKFHVDA